MSKIETNVDEQVDIEHDEAENVDFPALEDNDLILESKEEITEISSEADEDFYLNHIEQIDTAEDFYIVESGQTDEIEQTDKTE
jgi:hypothetical protein